MKVCVQGLWHLGSVIAACLASVGHEVAGLDPEQKTINGLRQGKAPLFEPGLDEKIQAGIGKGTLRFTNDAADAVAGAEVVWVAFDTPVDDDDNADVDYVVDQIKSILPMLEHGALILVSSQLPVGSIRKLETFANANLPEKRLEFACSPENLRLGKALDVFLNPDRIVVGVRSSEARGRLEQLLLPVSKRIEWMSVESAEMTKHAINAFLATSVTFANEIASICEVVGADAKEVERGLKSEQRIGPKAYLSPGGPFAGGTLARDIAFLGIAAGAGKLLTPLLSSVRVSNDEHKNWTRRKLLERFGDLHGITIAIWGLTYKPGTDTLRRSLAVELGDWLITQGARVHVHDPVVKKLPENWGDHVCRFENAVDAVHDAAALVLCTEWPEYKNVFPKGGGLPEEILLLDANRFLSASVGSMRVEYFAVGTPSKK